MAGGLVLLGGAPAFAQLNTTCNTVYGTTTCNTQPNGFYVLGRALAARAQHQKAAQLFRDDIANGRCDEARQIAMQYGNAQDVQAAGQCVSAAAPASAPPAGGQPVDDLSLRVSNAVEFHHCDEAKKIALDAGRLDMADQAMRLCTPQ